ncbi:MAG TPA: GNAT family N-acetyltransferase [Rikenellaceae bacterium]|nr:GNAT family N-acetyltransferase [Rikenellaceae bacterium]
MNLTIRETDRNEFFETENLTREAFWNLYKPGCDEHLALHQLRESTSYIPKLDLVALLDGRIVGHVITTKAKVVESVAPEDGDASREVLCVGPICADPSLQGKGVGSQLMRQTIARAAGMGFKGIILYGDPAYYSRFGFKNAQKYSISTHDNQNFDPFMALELYPGSLAGITGRFFEDPGFVTADAHLEEFEKLFPVKEKGEPRIILPV